MTDPVMKALIELMTRVIPGFTIAYKDESRFMRFLGVFAKLFNKDFMTRYTTTMGRAVYFPSRKVVEKNQYTYAKILAHEIVHLWDREQRGFVRYELWYFFPQILAALTPLSVLAVWFGPWWLLNLLWLAALAPWPAPGRKEIELRGYTMSMAMNYWRHGSVTDATMKWIAEQFTGWAYYKMWPFVEAGKPAILYELKVARSRIFTHQVLKDKVFDMVHTVVTEALEKH